jgi:branched-chain amino acid transport system substrate-binding protein
MNLVPGARAWAVSIALCGLAPVRGICGQGIETDTVTFVQVADVSGSRSALTKELDSGTLAYFRLINSQGGVHGRQLQLSTVDDGYVVSRTEEGVRERIKKDDVFAFVSSIGTANAEATLPLVNAARIPLVAPLSGAASLREPFSHYVFHLRSSYAQEVERMVEHSLTIGISRVAVFYDDDAFGQDVRHSVEQALARRKLLPVAVGKVERGSVDIAQAMTVIGKGRPQVVICGSFGKSLVEFIQAMKRSPAPPQFYVLSFFTSGASIRQLGADARGIGVTQVMPWPSAANTPLVREFTSAMARFAPDSPISYISLEGYATAKVLVEGLRRAGRDLSREKFIDSLETFRNLDLGGIFLSYSPSDHSGLKRVEITVIDGRGQVVR